MKNKLGFLHKGNFYSFQNEKDSFEIALEIGEESDFHKDIHKCEFIFYRDREQNKNFYKILEFE